MAIITYPLDGIQYNAQDAETYLCTRTSGVFSEEIRFTPNGMNITVSPFLAWIKNDDFSGKSVAITNDTTLTISPSEPLLGRIDRIVLRFDASANKSDLIVLKGTASSNPIAPTISRNPVIYDLCLCDIYVKPSTTVISSGDIKSNLLDESLCGIMRDGVTTIPTSQLQLQAQALLRELETSISMAQNGSPVLQSLGIKRGIIDIYISGETNYYASDYIPFNVAFEDIPSVVVTREGNSISGPDISISQNIDPQVSVTADKNGFRINVVRKVAGEPAILFFNWIAIGKVNWSNGGGDDEDGDGGGGDTPTPDPYYDDKIVNYTLYISNRPTTKTIGLNAYKGRTDFNLLVIPDNITQIYDGAFQNCTNLQSVEIGSGVEDVDSSVFLGCTALTDISVSNSNPNLKSVSNVLFDKGSIELLLYPSAKLGTTYTIPNTVRTIYPHAFENCSKLTSIYIPSSVTTIAESTFNNCVNLSTVYIPATMTIISPSAFANCSNLRDVNYSGTKSQWSDIYIGNNNSYLENAVIHCTDGDINADVVMKYTITTNVSPLGSGTVTGGGTYEEDTAVTLTASPNNGYVFLYWTDGNETRQTEQIMVFATKNQTWTAMFEAEENDVTKYTVTTSVDPENSGEVTGGGLYESGEKAVLTAISKLYGWIFGSWYVRFENAKTESYFDNPLVLDITQGCTVEAIFTPDIFTSGDWQYQFTRTLTDAVAIKKYNGKDSVVSIPTTIGGYSVAGILGGVFEDNTFVTKVTLPYSVLSRSGQITGKFFNGCTNLSEVVIDFPITAIFVNAFNGCTSLRDIYYSGTMAQWNNIDINSTGNDLSKVTIHCSDGNINDNQSNEPKEILIGAGSGGSVQVTKNGSVLGTNGRYTFNIGDTVTLTAEPDDKFTEWYDVVSFTLLSTENPYTFVVNSSTPTQIQAFFES